MDRKAAARELRAVAGRLVGEARRAADYTDALSRRIGESGARIHGWSVSWEHPGAVAWSEPGSSVMVYATPFYEGSSGIPVQVMSEEGEYLGDFEARMRSVGDLNEDVKEYLRVMAVVLPKVKRFVGRE